MPSAIDGCVWFKYSYNRCTTEDCITQIILSSQFCWHPSLIFLVLASPKLGTVIFYSSCSTKRRTMDMIISEIRVRGLQSALRFSTGASLTGFSAFRSGTGDIAGFVMPSPPMKHENRHHRFYFKNSWLSISVHCEEQPLKKALGNQEIYKPKYSTSVKQNHQRLHPNVQEFAWNRPGFRENYLRLQSLFIIRWRGVL